MKILIIVAMQSELDGFLNSTSAKVDMIDGFDYYKFTCNKHDCYVVKTEVGKVNAALITTTMIHKLKPQLVINAGIAGGLVENMTVLSTIYATKVAYYDVDLTTFGLPVGQLDNFNLYFKTNKELLLPLEENEYAGLIVSGDSFVSKLETVLNIKQNFPKALACDMESCSVVHTANYFIRKSLIIRVLSDNVYQKFAEKEYYLNQQKAIEICVEKTLRIINSIKK